MISNFSWVSDCMECIMVGRCTGIRSLALVPTLPSFRLPWMYNSLICISPHSSAGHRRPQAWSGLSHRLAVPSCSGGYTRPHSGPACLDLGMLPPAPAAPPWGPITLSHPTYHQHCNLFIYRSAVIWSLTYLWPQKLLMVSAKRRPSTETKTCLAVHPIIIEIIAQPHSGQR